MISALRDIFLAWSSLNLIVDTSQIIERNLQHFEKNIHKRREFKRKKKDLYPKILTFNSLTQFITLHLTVTCDDTLPQEILLEICVSVEREIYLCLLIISYDAMTRNNINKYKYVLIFSVINPHKRQSLLVTDM